MIGTETTYNDFPHGLRCGECHQEIEWGEPHYEWAQGMIDNPALASLTDEPIVEVMLVCGQCEAAKMYGFVPLFDADMNPIEHPAEPRDA